MTWAASMPSGTVTALTVSEYHLHRLKVVAIQALWRPGAAERCRGGRIPSVSFGRRHAAADDAPQVRSNAVGGTVRHHVVLGSAGKGQPPRGTPSAHCDASASDGRRTTGRFVKISPQNHLLLRLPRGSRRYAGRRCSVPVHGATSRAIGLNLMFPVSAQTDDHILTRFA